MNYVETEQASTLNIKEIYGRQGYRFIGSQNHSAVKICQWTKESLRNNRVCYKELWYPPVESHRCMMIAPYLSCNCSCLYCWRLHPNDLSKTGWDKKRMKDRSFDEPAQIVEESIAKRKLLLSGWKGNPSTDRKKSEEALKPTMMTLSLTGEPMLYPNISELIEEAKKREIITFLVTNGTLPESLESLDNLPFQLYISISAPNRKSYFRIVRPIVKDGWERLNRTLEILPSLDTRKVLRLTIIKGWNMVNHEEYAKLVSKAKPNYIEVKAYEWVGQSQQRLPKKAMPYMKDIEDFANSLSDLTGYFIKSKFISSGVVLLSK